MRQLVLGCAWVVVLGCGANNTGNKKTDAAATGSETTQAETTGADTNEDETTGGETTGGETTGGETTGGETTGGETTGGETTGGETTGGPCGCSSDDECPGEWHCVDIDDGDGHCHPPLESGQCWDQGDCDDQGGSCGVPMPELCNCGDESCTPVPGYCEGPASDCCSYNGDCDGGQVCVGAPDGLCQPAAMGDQCWSNDECPSGDCVGAITASCFEPVVFIAGECKPVGAPAGCCTSDSDCTNEGGYCAEVKGAVSDDGYFKCVGPANLDGQCWENDDCAGEELCINAFTCACDVDCDAPDLPGTCGTDYCADFGFTPGCSDDGNCAEGQECTILGENLCWPSSCGCDSATGETWCTDDCNPGICQPKSGGDDQCKNFTFAPGCSSDGQCEFDETCEINEQCNPSVCSCDPASGEVLCTADCQPGVCNKF